MAIADDGLRWHGGNCVYFLHRLEGLGHRASTVGDRERSVTFPPSLARTRWHRRLSFKPVGYPVTGPGGADMPIYPTRRASRALTRPTHRDLRLTSECQAQSCAVGGWWYGGISGHTLSGCNMAQRLSTSVCIVLCWLYEWLLVCTSRDRVARSAHERGWEHEAPSEERLTDVPGVIDVATGDIRQSSSRVRGGD